MNEEKDIAEFSDNSNSPIIEQGNSGQKQSLLSVLDKIESHVEMIRKKAFQIEEERDAMFAQLHAFKHSRLMEDLSEIDRNDIDIYVDRIFNRCSTIEVTVRTVRDKPQEDALHKINGFIDSLITELKHDPNASREKCLSFMNSCNSYDDHGMEDRIFEQALLECTVDDQKRVRRRLQGLMNYIEQLNFTA